MITIDVLGIVMYTQLALSVVLFLALQITVLLAHSDRFDEFGDWLVYRGTWYGIAFQFLSMVILAALVFYTQTDHARVTYTIILIIANTVWFVTTRLAFLILEYRDKQQMRRLE